MERVTDNVGAVGAVLRRDAGLGAADGLGRYIRGRSV